MKKLILIAIAFYLPAQVMGWGVLGHRISGEIAEQYLSAKAKARIKGILGNESLAMASNWADFIKSDPAYNYLGNWHYVNINRKFTSPELTEFLKNDTTTNAYTRIMFLSAELKKPNLDASKRLLYLRVLIHLVEDIHQPMHVGRLSDRGGNGFKVLWFGKAINLHSLWDSEFIESQQLSYTEYVKAINFTTRAQREALWREDISYWIYDSYTVAETLYSDIKPDDNLGYKYNFDHLDLLNSQLLKGGVRLAGLLNQIFG